jgi:hypothetical protein
MNSIREGIVWKLGGVPLKRGLRSGEENTDRIVMKVADTVGVEIKEKDISISHRLKTSMSYRGDKLQPPPLLSNSPDV